MKRFLLISLVGCWLGCSLAIGQENILETLTVVSDGNWRITENEINFGAYPLSYEQIVKLTKEIEHKDIAVHSARFYGPSKIISGTTPIWRYWKARDEGDQFAMMKKVNIPGDARIKSCKFWVNCDDAARVYINGKLLQQGVMNESVLHPQYDRIKCHQLTAFMYDQVVEVNSTDYLFSGHENVILVEAVNSPHENNHGYFSFKMEVVLEKKAQTTPTAPVVADKPKPVVKEKPVAKPQPTIPAPVAEKPSTTAPPTTETVPFDARTKAESLKVGDVLELKNIYFKPDKYDVNAESEVALRQLADYLSANPRLSIEVCGHTNLIPKDDFCLILSNNRAKSVYDYLVTKGIAAERLSYKGYGKQFPKINAINKEANAKNQRVEIVVKKV